MIGKRLSEIKGFENVRMNVKFVNHQFLDDLLDGKIYMKNFDYFIQLEKETKEKGVGDKLEIAHVVKSTNIKIINKKTKMVIATATSGELLERYKDTEKIPVFCVAQIRGNDFVITEFKDGVITAKVDLPEEDRIMFEETFGDTAVILTNEFNGKFGQTLREKGLDLYLGDVQYQDYSYYSPQRQKDFDERSPNFLFWKDDFFKNQREFRYIIPGLSVDDHYILEIGDIRDKSMVSSTHELLTEAEFEFEYK